MSKKRIQLKTEHVRPRGAEVTCQCADAAEPGCLNRASGASRLCGLCMDRGCRVRPDAEPIQLKNDLKWAALIVEAFADDCVGGRPDLYDLATRLREAARVA